MRVNKNKSENDSKSNKKMNKKMNKNEWIRMNEMMGIRIRMRW